MASAKQIAAQKRIGQLPHAGKTPAHKGSRPLQGPRVRLGRVTLRPRTK